MIGLEGVDMVGLEGSNKGGVCKYFLPNNNLKRCEANPNFCLTHGLRVLWRLATHFEARLFKQLPKVVKLYNFLG